jgi:putative FmdB family regulatory protein
MPLFEYLCLDCGKTSEHLVMGKEEIATCLSCGGKKLKKLLSAHSVMSANPGRIPGSGDTACCGSTPGHAGCAGPGSCCGKGPAH